MSLLASHSVQLNPIDFRRPIKVMACGPDALVTPDSHSRTSGVIALQSGCSSAGDDNSWKQASEREGSQWSAPTKWTLKGSFRL